MKRSKRKAQQNKPFHDFPLFMHATGQWAKKIKGRMYYFGVDADAALKKYLAERDDLQAGRRPRGVAGVGLALVDGCNRFLTNRKLAMDCGELSVRTFSQYHEACGIVIEQFGKNRTIADLRPDDFQQLRARLAKSHGPVGLMGKIQHVRTLFKWLFENGHIVAPVTMGTSMKRPARKLIRRAKHEAGPRMFDADQLRAIIDSASMPLRAMILLGLNCGYGASDISGLPKSALDLDAGFVNFPRPKTEVSRRCPLWPETVAALREAIDDRPTAKAPEDADCVFLTRLGQRWVRVYEGSEHGKLVVVDSVGGEFKKVIKALGLDRPKLGFYALRHTFRTVADRSQDQPACNAIMGHVADDSDMPSRYRQMIDDSRLRAVVAVVRAWLWPEAPAVGV